MAEHRHMESGSNVGTGLGITAAVVMLLGLACIALVVIAGLSGFTVAPAFTWMGMVLVPVAFILLMVVLGMNIARRRAA